MSDTKTFIRPLRDKTVRNMALLCAIGFGGFCAWGAIAPLEEGVAASGQIVVEDNRQMVQHLEGGIVSELRVKEGEMVEAGDVLVVLQRTASLSSRDQIIQEYGALAASVARLRALQENQNSPDFSVLDTLELGDIERRANSNRRKGLEVCAGGVGCDFEHVPTTIGPTRSSYVGRTSCGNPRRGYCGLNRTEG